MVRDRGGIGRGVWGVRRDFPRCRLLFLPATLAASFLLDIGSEPRLSLLARPPSQIPFFPAPARCALLSLPRWACFPPRQSLPRLGDGACRVGCREEDTGRAHRPPFPLLQKSLNPLPPCPFSYLNTIRRRTERKAGTGQDVPVMARRLATSVGAAPAGLVAVCLFSSSSRGTCMSCPPQPRPTTCAAAGEAARAVRSKVESILPFLVRVRVVGGDDLCRRGEGVEEDANCLKDRNAR